MIKPLAATLLLLGLVLGSNLRADESTEVDLPTLPPPFLHHEVSLTNMEGLARFSSTGHQLSLGAGYDYTIVPGLQWGLAASIRQRVEAPDRDLSISMTFGPTLNFPMIADWRDAWFFRSGIGVVYENFDLPTSNRKDTYVKLATTLEVGKRFQIFQNLVYRPSVQLTTVLGAGARERFVFNIQVVSLAGVF